MDYTKQIETWLEVHREEMIADICALCRVDSERGEAAEGKPFGEGPAAGLAKGMEICAKNGFAPENVDNYCVDALLNDRPLQLDILCHLDVVPAGDGWTATKPFEPLVTADRIIGRGTADDKGPAVAVLYAMRALRELGVPLSGGVRLILGSDEECGSGDIAYYFSRKKHAPMSVSPDADFPLIFLEKGRFEESFDASFAATQVLPRVVLAEGGVKSNVVPARAKAVVLGMTAASAAPFVKAAEDSTGTQMTVRQAEGGVEIDVQGVQVHAANPEGGNNALTALISLLASLPLADCDSTARVRSLARLFPHGDYYGRGLGVAREDEISGKLTLTMDVLRLTEEGLEGTIDCRTCCAANEENTADVANAKLRAEGLHPQVVPMTPAHYVPKDSPLVTSLLSSVEKYTGRKEEPLAIGGGTYVHEIENGVACGCADPAVDNHMHGPDEFVLIDQLMMSAKIYADAIIRLCGEK